MVDVFCNTSPLQYLHQVGHLELLPTLFKHVQVAEAVVAELAEGMRRETALPNVEHLPWVTTRAVLNTGELVSGLGRGETETLALSLESPGSLVILDDAEARRVAKAAQLDVVGTVGVLLLAKERGHIETIRPIMDRLGRLGFRLSELVRMDALAKAGEQ